MFKIIIGGRRRAGMTHRDYAYYAEHRHGSTVAHDPGLMLGYIQNHVLDAAYGTRADGWVAGPDFDSFSEISFPDGAAFGQSIADPYYRDTIQPDELNFVCHSAIILLATRVVEEPVAATGTAPLKVMRFVTNNGAADAGTFEAAWHCEAARLAEHPALRSSLRRMTRSISVADSPDAKLPSGFIANAPLSAYTGVESLWFETDAAWSAVEAYRAAIDEPASHLAGLIDRRQEALFIVEERCIVAERSADSRKAETVR